MRTVFVLFILLFFAPGCQTAKPAVSENKSPTGERYKEVLATDLGYDLATGEIQYTLPEDCLVRIRIGLRDGGAMLRTLVDWEKRSKGLHKEIWDGQDDSLKIDFGKNKNFIVILSCLAPGGPKDPPPDFKGFHSSPRFSISFPEADGKSHDGEPVVQGSFPIRVSLDKDDDLWLRRTKYEVSFFLDQTFLFEDEEGSNPYTFLLNTAGINEGEHVLTVNVIGYEGEIGTHSVKIQLNKTKS